MESYRGARKHEKARVASALGISPDNLEWIDGKLHRHTGGDRLELVTGAKVIPKIADPVTAAERAGRKSGAWRHRYNTTTPTFSPFTGNRRRVRV